MSTTMLPFLPGLPEPLRDPTRQIPGLKASTVALLQQAHRGKVRRMPAHAYDLVAYDPATHGLDVLLYWYMQVRSAGEHLALWGDVGRTPTAFCTAFAGTELLLLHVEGAAWQAGEGLMGALWTDDRVPALRARAHFWFAAAYRQRTLSLPLAEVLLRGVFEDKGYTLLEGRTPVTNTLALRFIQRLGFVRRAVLPEAEWVAHPDGSRTLVDVVFSTLTRAQWRQD
jgi:hypothetical protein